VAPQLEAWLRGPLDGVLPELQSVAHALVQVREDLEGLQESLTNDDLWLTPGGAASIGFHVRHLAGSLDRLLTYARGEPLSAEQRSALVAERDASREPNDVAGLFAHTFAALDVALAQVRATRREDLLAHRGVGKAARPSTVIGLLAHAAEHSARHTGQAITTARIIKGLQLGPSV
jgi:hypothetical protein